MRLYKASGKFGILGLPMLIIGALLSGLIAGGLAFFISYQFNLFLICVFPLIMGVVGGFIMILAVKLGKVRNGLLAGLFGLLAGIAIVLVFRGGEYYFATIHDGAVRAAERQLDDASETEVFFASIPIGLEDVKLDDFVEFNQELGEAGTSISYRSSNIELNETMTWILWIIEALAIVGICFFLPLGQASEPFDEKGNRWFGRGEWFASVPMQYKAQFVDLLKRGDFKGAGALMTRGTLPLPRVDIDLAGDASDDTRDILLKVNDVTPGRRSNDNNNVSLVISGLLSKQELEVLRSSVQGTATPFGM